MRLLFIITALVSLAAAGPCAAVDLCETDGNGRIISMRVEDSCEQFQSDVVFALPGWSRTVSLAPGFTDGVRFDRYRNTRSWTGSIKVGEAQSCTYSQSVCEVDGEIRLHFEVTAETDLNLASVVFFLKMPLTTFAGGSGEMTSNGVFVSAANPPAEQGLRPHFLFGNSDRVSLRANSGDLELIVQSDVPRYFIVQDERFWNSQTYSLYTELHQGGLRKGEKTGCDFRFTIKGHADHSAATVSVQPGTVKYRFEGMGGNFVFGLDSPVPKYALENLRLQWGRIQMNLLDWAPDESKVSPVETNWPTYKSRDAPQSELRREFLMAAMLTKYRIPYISSIWYLPEWMYVDPGRDKETFGRRINPAKWDKLLDCIGSYLLYARRQYGVEPAMFSFNESREGVHVLMSAEEHRDAIARIGAYLEKSGLKTKMLLADVATVRDTVPFAIPAEIDPVARAYTRAVGVHTWDGGSPEHLAAWGSFASRIHKPLLMTEVGTDPYAWHTPWVFQDYGYALRELRMYQELLTHASPQCLMPWQLTGDYPTVRTRKMSGGGFKFMPTARFWFIKHIANLTPASADCLGTSSSASNLLVTAFSASEGNGKRFAVHIANFGGARSLAVSGLPGELTEFVPVVTAEDESFSKLTALRTSGGSVQLCVKGMSLTTLTGVSKK